MDCRPPSRFLARDLDVDTNGWNHEISAARTSSPTSATLGKIGRGWT
jgi:hypothetical protein